MAPEHDDVFVEQRLAAEIAGYQHYDIMIEPYASKDDIHSTCNALDILLDDSNSRTCRSYIIGHRLKDKATRVFTLAVDPGDYGLFRQIMALEHVRTINLIPSVVGSAA